MMLVLAHIYEIPEFNVGYYFYLGSDDNDPERKPLCAGGDDHTTNYNTDKESENKSETFQETPNNHMSS